MDKASITLNISLPLDADKSEAIKAIAAINAFFNDGISPKDAATVNAAIGAFPQDGVRAAMETQPAAGAAPVQQTATTDKNGLPWDERIHSSSKAFNQDGTWRYKKGVADTLKKQVEDALRVASGGAAAAPGTTVANLPPLAGNLPPPPVTAPAPVENPAYTEFVQFVTSQPRITPDWLKASLTALGVPDGDMQNLAHMADKIPGILAQFKTALGVA